MSRASSLLSLLLLSILPFVALADGEACHPDASGERDTQAPDRRRVAKHSEEKHRLKHLWQQLSHEERDALRQQMRANWERMTPERRRQLRQTYRERQELRENLRGEGSLRKEEQAQWRKARGKAHEAYWQSLTPKERETLRNALRETIRHWRHEEEAAKIINEALAENADAGTTPPDNAPEKSGQASRHPPEKQK
ncbi:MAG: hypothetical protein LBF51_10775 [Zoogloeaceae bacterium]|jgi:hypothetical protein|nr:hypothetical protein [Zoogloeaceae bacterium]